MYKKYVVKPKPKCQSSSNNSYKAITCVAYVNKYHTMQVFYLHTEYCIDPSNYTLSNGQNQNYLFENGGVRFLYGPF